MRRIKVISLLLFLALLMPLVSGCAGGEKEPAAVPTEINIGVYEPMTGASASGGQMTWEGIQLANEMHPEVLGQAIRLHLEDNKTDKTEAANAVTRLIDQKEVVAIIGSYGSSLSIAGGEVAKNKKIPVVGCSPTNPLVTQDNDYYFRVCFIDPFQGRVRQNMRWRSWAPRRRRLSGTFRRPRRWTCQLLQGGPHKSDRRPNCVLAELEYNTGDQDFTANYADCQPES